MTNGQFKDEIRSSAIANVPLDALSTTESGPSRAEESAQNTAGNVTLNRHPFETAEPNCKGCSATVHVKPEEIAQLYGSDILLRPGSVKLVTEAEFVRRLSTCGGCSDYRWGTTCRWSGALMELKAKLAATHCPSPYGSKWA